jgi:hypothetical protein
MRHEGWVEFLEIFIAEIEEFGGELDTSGWIWLVLFSRTRDQLTASSNDGKIEKLVP